MTSLITVGSGPSGFKKRHFSPHSLLEVILKINDVVVNDAGRLSRRFGSVTKPIREGSTVRVTLVMLVKISFILLFNADCCIIVIGGLFKHECTTIFFLIE